MTLTTAVSFQPVARKENLDRLAAFPPSPAITPAFWTEVHDEVQRQLELLETEVRGKAAGVRVDAGWTKGEKFFLFSYRTFSMPDNPLDPVVAGITFAPAHQGVSVEADVSGEQAGDSIFAVPSKTVAYSREELIEAARESARKICESAEAIAFALQDPSRRVEWAESPKWKAP